MHDLMLLHYTLPSNIESVVRAQCQLVTDINIASLMGLYIISTGTRYIGYKLYTHAKVVYTCGETAFILLGVNIEAASHLASISHNDYCGMDDQRIGEKKTKLIGTYVHIIRGMYIQKELLLNQRTLRKIAAEQSYSCSSAR